MRLAIIAVSLENARFHMPVSLDHRYLLAAQPVAQRAGTEGILLALQAPLVEFAARIGCNDIGSSGDDPRGIPFRLAGRGEDLFAFWVERLADKRRGLAAISFDPKRLAEELRPAFRLLLAELRRRTGEVPVRTKRYPSSAIGFVTVADGLEVLARLDGFVSEAVERLGLQAFAPYVPKLKPEPAEVEVTPTGAEASLMNGVDESPPPDVDPVVWAQIVRRRGQKRFRKELLEAYSGTCAITGCDVVAALEAAHLTPYAEEQAYRVTDGILLRADIHTLFDLNLISVDPETFCVRIAPSLRSHYAEWESTVLTVPGARAKRPAVSRIAEHYGRWCKLVDA